jgi:hypothetical protein
VNEKNVILAALTVSRPSFFDWLLRRKKTYNVTITNGMFVAEGQVLNLTDVGNFKIVSPEEKPVLMTHTFKEDSGEEVQTNCEED